MPSYCCLGEIERDTRINKGEHDVSVVDYGSIASICSGHPMNFFCIGGMGLQFSVRGIF
jgi:hypothetical protein